MAKVLIIGGAGYIGCHIAKLLHKQKHEILNFDNLSTGFTCLLKYGELYKGDLLNVAELEDCFSKFKPDAIFHFANFAAVGESVERPDIYFRNNVQGSFHLLEACRKHTPDAAFIFSSSCTVYGEPQTDTIDESHPIGPINPYGRCKLFVEDMLRDYSTAFGLKHCNLRYFNAAGADSEGELGELHNPETHLIPRILNYLHKPETADPVKIFGDDYPTPDGTCIRDYIHVEDLAVAHQYAMEHLLNGKDSVTVNLGSTVGYSVKEVLDCIEKVTQKKITIPIGPRRPGDSPRAVAASGLAKKLWNWQTKHELESIIQTAWNWTQKTQS